MQYFLPCWLTGVEHMEFVLPPFPFDTSYRIVAPRMDLAQLLESLQWFTSDELAQHLLTITNDPKAWTARRLQWQMKAGSIGLIEKTITGQYDSAVQSKSKSKVTSPVELDMPRELQLDSIFPSSGPSADAGPPHHAPSEVAGGGACEDVSSDRHGPEDLCMQ